MERACSHATRMPQHSGQSRQPLLDNDASRRSTSESCAIGLRTHDDIRLYLAHTCRCEVSGSDRRWRRLQEPLAHATATEHMKDGGQNPDGSPRDKSTMPPRHGSANRSGDGRAPPLSNASPSLVSLHNSCSLVPGATVGQCFGASAKTTEWRHNGSGNEPSRGPLHQGGAANNLYTQSWGHICQPGRWTTTCCTMFPSLSALETTPDASRTITVRTCPRHAPTSAA